jgi:hypothetical protein
MIRGRVQNGVVVLDDPQVLREGTEVAVKPLSRRGKRTGAGNGPAVSRALARLAGKAVGLPPDAARNVDHYLYGHAKR